MEERRTREKVQTSKHNESREREGENGRKRNVHSEKNDNSKRIIPYLTAIQTQWRSHHDEIALFARYPTATSKKKEKQMKETMKRKLMMMKRRKQKKRKNCWLLASF